MDPSEETIEDGTRAGDEWPLPEPYRVGGPASAPGYIELGTSGSDEEETIVVASAAAPRSRWLPLRGAEVALGAALVVAAGLVAGVLLASPSDSASEAGGTSAPPTVAKVGGVAPAPGQRSPLASASRRTVEIEVPDVEGTSVAAARQTLRGLGLTSEIRPIESDRPEGVVLKQDPGAGDRAARGSAIVVVVASGPPEVAVPKVVGLRVDRASRLVRRDGLEVEVRFVRSSKRAGIVVEQRPEGGSLRRGGVLELSVAKAPPEVTTTRVPPLEGLRLDQARPRLQARGLRWTVDEVPSSRPAGVVIRQSERPGAVVQKGTRVTLEVSSGPQLLAVPDVVGLDVVVARQQLEAAGFVVIVTDFPTTDPGEDGIVLEQSPGGGTRAPKGSEVTLDVGLAG